MGPKKSGLYWSEPTLDVLDSISPPTPSPRINNVAPVRIYSYEHISDEMLTFIPDVDGTIGSLHRRKPRTSSHQIEKVPPRARKATPSGAEDRESSVDSGFSVRPLSSHSTEPESEQGSYPFTLDVTELHALQHQDAAYDDQSAQATTFLRKATAAILSILSFAVASMNDLDATEVQNCQLYENFEGGVPMINDLESLEDFLCTPGPVSLVNEQ
jgi:hypothetical protein